MYTKGKWVARIGNGSVDVIEEKTGFGVVHIGHYTELEDAGYTVEEAEANAKLISAAPDLLEACQNFLKVINRSATALEYYGEAISLADAAILKAVG